jgi:hypothetical protein
MTATVTAVVDGGGKWQTMVAFAFDGRWRTTKRRWSLEAVRDDDNKQ